MKVHWGLLLPLACHAFRPPQLLRGTKRLTPHRQRRRRVRWSASLLHPQTFDLTRRVFNHGLGLCYFNAFLIAHNQNKALIGDEGIIPARERLEWEWAKGSFSRDGRPTLLKLLYRGRSASDTRLRLDPWLRALAVTGMVVSASPLLTGRATFPVFALLWTLYTSIVNVGDAWYSYGWESQLLETGFLAAFCVPFLGFLGWNAASTAQPPAWLGCLGSRWLLFRIMIGSGLIKIRPSSSKCWRCWRKGQRSCMEFFYETQPVPSPMARRLHFMPSWFHTGSTYVNHLVELVLPWVLLIPPLTPTLAALCTWGGGVAQLAFQFTLCMAGNLSFLNVLTMLPAIWLLDDAFLRRLWHPALRHLVSSPAAASVAAAIPAPVRLEIVLRRHCLPVAVALFIAQQSLPVVQNLFGSGRQSMNRSFNQWKFVNTYGAFGYVGEVRDEMVIKGTRGDVVAPDEEWLEYEFAVKPGSVTRRLPVIVPYHHRLDWCIWISTLRSPEATPWLKTFLLKLLQNDVPTTRLLADGGRGNPFAHDGGGPPKYLKVERYRYSFVHPRSDTTAAAGAVWTREKLGPYFPRQPIFSAAMFE